MSKKNKEKKVTIQDAYDEGGRTISIDEAHRDVVYNVPSVYRQVATCFMIQMKRYTKHKLIWFLLILIIAIPVGTYVLNLKEPTLLSGYTSNENMSAILILLPLLGTLIACMTCAKILPQEFNERTVYLSLPLPMSRNAFYYGKFLAGFFVAAGIIVAAYGAAMLSSRYLIGSTVTFSVPILLSMAVMICATFFCCSYTYMRGSRSKRGSTLLPFIVMYVLLPILAYGILIIWGTVIPMININADIENYVGKYIGIVIGYFPCFSYDLALANLGSGLIDMVTLSGISSFGFLNLLGGNASMGLTLGSNILISCAVNVILGMLCLHRGSRKVARRDM